jgi:hypothetical protein
MFNHFERGQQGSEDQKSRKNTARGLNFDHTIRGEHIWEVWG